MLKTNRAVPLETLLTPSVMSAAMLLLLFIITLTHQSCSWETWRVHSLLKEINDKVPYGTDLGSAVESVNFQKSG